MKTGTYYLIIKLETYKNIRIGKRPLSVFPAGFYVYVGSAMNNIDKRIARHMSTDKKFRWHIDWLLAESKIIAVRRIESEFRLECDVNHIIYQLSEKTVMKGFGSSDCSCDTHLIYFKDNPVQQLDITLALKLSKKLKSRYSSIRITKTPVIPETE